MSWTNQNTRRFALYSLVLGMALLLVSFYFFRHVSLLCLALALLVVPPSLYFQKLRSLGVMGVALLLSLSLVETAAPWFKKITPKTVTQGVYWQYGSEIGHLGIPGVHQVRESLEDEKELIYNVISTIGEDGFRTTPSAKKGLSRINFFGCSFTYGYGLNDDETFPYYVAQKIENISVKNFGFTGYGVHQALAILQSDRDTSGPINFLLTAPWHAPRSSCKTSWTAGSPRYKLQPNGDLIRVGRCPIWEDLGIIEKLLSRSTLFSMYQEIKNSGVKDSDFELYLALVGEIARLSRERNQRFIVGFIKEGNWFFNGTNYTNEKIYSAIKDMADEVINLTLESDRKYYIHPLDPHPTSLANREMANLAASMLRRYLD